MAYLNANIPVIECCVRGNYLRDQKESHEKGSYDYKLKNLKEDK